MRARNRVNFEQRKKGDDFSFHFCAQCLVSMYVRNEIKKSIHSGNVSSLILCAVSIISVLVSVMNDHFSMISFLFVIADILYAIEGEKFIHTGRISMFYRLYNYSYLFTSLLDIIRVLLSPAISHPVCTCSRPLMR